MTAGTSAWARRHRRLIAAGALVTVGVLGGCGVPIDRGPTTLSKGAVPFGLLAPSASPTTSTSGPAPAEVTVQVFLLAPTGHVAPVARDVASPATLAAVLGALVDGPTNAEAAGGLQSAIPAQTAVLSATITSGVASIDLGGTFGQLVGQAQIQAVAQIVFTATALPGVSGVTFALAGQPVSVPIVGGAEAATVNRAQFAALAP